MFSHDTLNKLAGAIVNDFDNPCVRQPLMDGIIKVAQEHGMSANYANELTRMVNTRAHLQIFQKEGSDSKYVEFDVVDPKDVMSALYGDTPTTSCKTASVRPYDDVFDLHVPDERFTRSKVASAEELELPVTDDVSPSLAAHQKHAATQRAARLRDEVEIRVLQTERRFQEKVASLVRKTRSLYSPDISETFPLYLSIAGEEKFAHYVKEVLAAGGKVDMTTKVARQEVLVDHPLDDAVRDIFGEQKALYALNGTLEQI